MSQELEGIFWKPGYVERLRLGSVRGNNNSERVLTGHC